MIPALASPTVGAALEVGAILEGHVIPYLMIDGASDAIAFYQRAFDAAKLFHMPMPDASVAHAEMKVGGATIYLADAPHDMPGEAGSPRRYGGTTVLIHRYVPDVGAVVQKAEAAGANPRHCPARVM